MYCDSLKLICQGWNRGELEERIPFLNSDDGAMYCDSPKLIFQGWNRGELEERTPFLNSEDGAMYCDSSNLIFHGYREHGIKVGKRLRKEELQLTFLKMKRKELLGTWHYNQPKLGKSVERYKYNGIWCDCHASERFSAIKPGIIHHYLHRKMSVTSQEYDSYCPFVWFCHLIRDFPFRNFLGVQYFCDFIL